MKTGADPKIQLRKEGNSYQYIVLVTLYIYIYIYIRHINVLLAKVFIMRTFDTYQVDNEYCRNSLPSVQFTWRLDGIGKKSPFFLIMRKIWKTGFMTVSKFGRHVSYLSFKRPKLSNPPAIICSWQFLMNQETHINPLAPNRWNLVVSSQCCPSLSFIFKSRFQRFNCGGPSCPFMCVSCPFRYATEIPWAYLKGWHIWDSAQLRGNFGKSTQL